ncbi:ribosome assembly cofactor RimP [Salibacteraceae bacterium]|jgi:ribosome maturation factor RimP|nr:ribosome assembly cofactor RimP [Salibacteraceae bacterium]MDB0002619.1 ribosome assembly cofactor RimP [Salibacteraceae bacterium]MDB4105088.1 ribosome assembly cofactor RimP [Salibacteraceae bacterium]MDB9709163.1 ribosome assembly cofactor RimP [Salibacteraceae bacterium]MDC1303905.1 ribosome assembly cofactor RimP [Salibacteraceae bacterium]
MISESYIRQLVEEKLEGTDMFIVELSVSSNSKIVVEIDGMSGVAIADCVEVSRQIESNLDRDQEDFELQVSSAGIDKPLRDKRQFEKNIGREVKIVLQDSAELKGELLEVGDSLKLKLPASKKKKLPEREEIIAWENIRETKILISFK